MSTLHIMFNMDTKTFVGASVGGKHLEGIAAVALSNGSVSVTDTEGRVLLGPQPREAGEVDTPLSSESLTKAQADIAASFGPAHGDGEEG